jgi:hypothetical protein
MALAKLNVAVPRLYLALSSTQISEIGERMREPRHGGLGQAAALAELLIAEHAIAVAKAGQHLEPARQRGHEVAVRFDDRRFDNSRLERRYRPPGGLRSMGFIH